MTGLALAVAGDVRYRAVWGLVLHVRTVRSGPLVWLLTWLLGREVG
jgi:hypothetical protein